MKLSLCHCGCHKIIRGWHECVSCICELSGHQPWTTKTTISKILKRARHFPRSWLQAAETSAELIVLWHLCRYLFHRARKWLTFLFQKHHSSDINKHVRTCLQIAINTLIELELAWTGIACLSWTIIHFCELIMIIQHQMPLEKNKAERCSLISVCAHKCVWGCVLFIPIHPWHHLSSAHLEVLTLVCSCVRCWSPRQTASRK